MAITGFGQFPGVLDNPSHTLLERLRDTPDLLPADAVCRLIEVSYGAVAPALEELLADPPAALLLTGFSRRATGLRLETPAHDFRSPDRQDAFGFNPPAGDAEPQYLSQSRADLAHISNCVIKAGIDCVLSDDAGAYVCNHTYHTALRLIAERDLPTLAVFVHIPAISGTDLAGESEGSMPLDSMARGVAMIARELLQAGEPAS